MCLAFSLQWRRGSCGNEGNGRLEAVFTGGHGAVRRIYLTLRGDGEAGRPVGGVDSSKGGNGFPVGDSMDGGKGGMICWDRDGFFIGGSIDGDGVDGDEGWMVGGDGISSDSAELERIEGVFTAGAEDRWRRDDGALRRGGWKSR